MESRRTIIGAGLLLLSAAIGASAPSQLVDQVLAVVGADVITLSDARAVTTFDLYDVSGAKDPTAAALEHLVNRALMLGEVSRYSASEPDTEAVTRAFEKLKARFPSAADFKAALARTAMTEERLRSFVRDGLRIEMYVDQRFGGAAAPTEQEIIRYYQEHQNLFLRGGLVLPLEEVRAEVIERASAERRTALVADWIERLGRRTEIRVIYRSGRTAPDGPPGV